MDRKKKILEILKEKGKISVKELSKIFKVSEMTIYRDVRELEKEKKVKRKYGLIILNKEEKTKNVLIKQCPICEKPITRPRPYRIILENSETVEACCEHCGLLLHQKYENQKVSAITYDFITDSPITAFDAYFVVGSEAIPCCSPSVIPFASRETALKFKKGFGGEVLNFVDTYNKLTQKIQINLKSCCEDDNIKNFIKISEIKNKSK